MKTTLLTTLALSTLALSAHAADRAVQCTGNQAHLLGANHSPACIQFNFTESSTPDNSALTLNGFSGHVIYNEGNTATLDCNNVSAAENDPNSMMTEQTYTNQTLISNPKYQAKTGSKYANDFEFSEVTGNRTPDNSDYLFINLKYPKPTASEKPFTLHFDLQEDQNAGTVDLTCKYL